MDCSTIVLILTLILLLITFGYCFCTRLRLPEYFIGGKLVFKAPPSFTSISNDSGVNGHRKLKSIVTKENLNDIIRKLKIISHQDKRGFTKDHSDSHTDSSGHLEKGNQLTFLSYFSCWDKWPGCLPDPYFQGNCGSCWAFASVTCLSARFYIESCGNTGCYDYPQFNQRALDYTLINIDKNYKFNKVVLDNLNDIIDTNQDGKLTETEWINAVKTAQVSALKQDNERFVSLQLLTYMLNFQSFGGIHFDKRNKKTKEVTDRAKQTFKEWSKDGIIDIEEWKKTWFQKPIPLSAEKLIACCYPVCYKDVSVIDINNPKLPENNPQCSGSSLTDAWKMLRDTGTVTSLCVGYNLDHWEEGEPIKTCKELLGPNYSYCSSYSVEDWSEHNKFIKDAEETNFEPITIHRKDREDRKDRNKNNKDTVPWANPQLFRFKARNAYKVNNSMVTIQREIINRGPVTTGFHVYPDFQYEFGSNGMGGQLFNESKNPETIVGGSKDSLIYMHVDDGTEPLSGHAITITGWGTYKDIPYWICLNSWGTEWGTSGYTPYDNRDSTPNSQKGGGYFWFVRGINNCEFEDNVVVGQPNLENISYPGTVGNYGWSLPYPDLDDIELISTFDDVEIKDDDDVSIDIIPPVEGGGHYISRVEGNGWEINSMSPPSPFTFFWPVERPKFVVGRITSPMLKSVTNGTIMMVDDQTIRNFKRIVEIQPNPIFIINNEQLQFVKFSKKEGFANSTKKQLTRNVENDNTVIVHRSIDNSVLEYHPINSVVVIFPFRGLGIDDLKFLNTYESAFE
jgi:hypothetical protein